MKKQNYPKNRRRYDATFKQNALQMIADGRSVRSVSEALGVSEALLYRWRRKAAVDKKEDKDRDKTEEIRQLKKRLAEVEMERDILKKALSIFSRQT